MMPLKCDNCIGPLCNHINTEKYNLTTNRLKMSMNFKECSVFGRTS